MIALYSELSPDLIILDLVMPAPDGFELMAKLAEIIPPSVRAGLRGLPPGDYVVPHAASKERGSEAFQAKMKEGPIAFMTVFPAGEFSMGASLVQWVVYCIPVGLFAAYVAGIALSRGIRWAGCGRAELTLPV